jgi:hypothetical protein
VRGEDLGEAECITAKIVHKHIIDVAFLADIAVMVLRASEDVNEAFPLEKMVIVPALQASPPIGVALLAFSDLQAMHRNGQTKEEDW